MHGICVSVGPHQDNLETYLCVDL